MTAPVEAPVPSLRHLAALSDASGTFEHARLAEPRKECGYCTDDAGRLLAIAARLPADPHAPGLAGLALSFLERAHRRGGRFHLRRSAAGAWTTDPDSDDAAGRALLGLGTAAGAAPWPGIRRRARALFDEAAAFRSTYPRAMAYAALGAAEVVRAEPGHEGARRLLHAAADRLPGPSTDPAWRWPEPRLSYANALLPDATIAVAAALGLPERTAEAVELLAWLAAQETLDDHFSFTPVGGRGPGGPQPAFDQQPIEAWAMADACARAYRHTGDPRWRASVQQAAAWFLGQNDTGVAMYDPVTGGGFDGLRRRGVNRNQGAESTLAFVATMVQLRSLPPENGLGRDRPVGAAQAAAASASSRWATEAVAAPTQRSAAPYVR